MPHFLIRKLEAGRLFVHVGLRQKGLELAKRVMNPRFSGKIPTAIELLAQVKRLNY